MLEIQEKLGGEAVLLIDPAAALVDAALIDGMVNHAAENGEIDFFFSQAAPGLSGVLIRKSMLTQLASQKVHPGTLLAYRPDLTFQDPISSLACVPTPTTVARTSQRFMLDCKRQMERVAGATQHLNGELASSEAETLVHSLTAAPLGALPREVTLELTTRRASSPIFGRGNR